MRCYKKRLSSLFVALCSAFSLFTPGVYAAEETPTVTVESGTFAATLNAPSEGWAIGQNTFSVSADKPFMVLVSYDNGTSYKRLSATPGTDNSYEFTTEIEENTLIRVNRKGDLNGDGAVKAAEVRQIFKMKNDTSSGTALKRMISDLNGDGAISAAEVRQIFKDTLNNGKVYCDTKDSGFKGWTDTYTVTFQDYDGTVLKTQKVESGFSAIPPADPQRDGYDFNGWDGSYTAVSGDVTVVATYSEKASTYHTVTFYQEDQATVIDSQSIREGESAVAPIAPAVEGKLFTGWTGNYTKISADVSVIATYIDETSDNIFMISNAEASAGETITVTIELKGNTKYCMYQGVVNYDPTCLEYVSNTAGAKVYASTSGSTVRFAYYNALKDYTENMTVLTLQFNVLDTDNSVTHLSITDGQVQDSQEAYLNVNVVGGSVYLK